MLLMRIFVVLFLSIFSLISQEKNMKVVINDGGFGFGLSTVEKNGRAIVQVTEFRKGSGWGIPVNISAIDRDVISAPLLQINQTGFATAVWQSVDTDCQIQMEVATYLKDIGWQPPHVISSPSDHPHPGDYALQIDEEGGSLVLWKSLSSEGSDARSSVCDRGIWFNLPMPSSNE